MTCNLNEKEGRLFRKTTVLYLLTCWFRLGVYCSGIESLMAFLDCLSGSSGNQLITTFSFHFHECHGQFVLLHQHPTCGDAMYTVVLVVIIVVTRWAFSIKCSTALADLHAKFSGALPPTGPNSFFFTYIFTKKCLHRKSTPS